MPSCSHEERAVPKLVNIVVEWLWRREAMASLRRAHDVEGARADLVRARRLGAYARAAAAAARDEGDAELASKLYAEARAYADSAMASYERDETKTLSAADAVALAAAQSSFDATIATAEAKLVPYARLLLQRAVRLGALACVLVVLVASVARRPERAHGHPWKTSSAWPGFASHGDRFGDEPAMRAAGLPRDVLFHTAEEDSPWVEIDLGAAIEIRSVELWNRSDCCYDRTVPLVIELAGEGRQYRTVASRDDYFSSWTARFPRQRARFVRVRITRRSILHLEGIFVR
jgi:hypothetical protein